MAGIYVHIPFCKRKCFYCDFYSVASQSDKEKFIRSLQKEISLQKNYLQGEEISSIYFGGGTPSLFSASELSGILKNLHQHFSILSDAETTIETNPDDITEKVAHELLNAGVNRISTGIQSFSDDDLKLLNRGHNAQQAIDAITILKKAGFSNISADLIYGLPGMSIETWKKNLDIMFARNIQHISAYHLSVEPGTVFAHFLEKGKIKLPDEEQGIEQFKMLIHAAKTHGFIHYEISNFALANFHSKHNSAYWQQKKYLGLGPSAHSFNGSSRQWNVSNLKEYIDAIEKNEIPFSIEQLSARDKFNEYVMTSLRTKQGIDLTYLSSHFNNLFCSDLLLKAKKYEGTSHLNIIEDKIILTDEGLFISDRIIAELFV